MFIIISLFLMKKENKSKIYKKWFQYFLQGLIVIAPIAITIFVIYSVFNWIDNILPDLIHYFFPHFVGLNNDGSIKKVPGLGFIIIILFVFIIGRLSSIFFLNRFAHFIDTILDRLPGVKHIYGSVKDFLEAFTGNKKKFDKPVLVNVDKQNVWRIGFITKEDLSMFELTNHIAVYVPHSYAVSGITYLVEKDKVMPIRNIPSAEIMKFVISAGVTSIETHNNNNKESNDPANNLYDVITEEQKH